MRRRAAARLAAPLLAAAACAQPGSPPGGDPDNTPPRVVSVAPEPFSVLQALDEPVVIRFDERISERLEGISEFGEAVIVSPATSPVRARRRRSSVEISLIRDWEPNRVYVVEVRPLFRDLFGNQRREPIRLVFSTGAAIPETALAGFVRDPLTAEPAEGARIEARSRRDSAAYVAIADSAGFFALSYLPPGAFDLTAWLDQDRDRATDFFEAQDTADAEIGAGDTVVVELAVLPRDSTPARLARAEPVDSVRVRLLFDDYFAVAPPDGTARLLRAGDSSFVSGATLLHGARLDSILAAEREAREALEAARRADSLAALGDTAAARVDTTAAPAGAPGRARPDALAADRRPALLPSRELFVLLPEPLTPDSAYLVVVDGVTNIRGVPGGGGTARFVAPPPPPPDTTAADTAGADTAGADTTRGPAPPARDGPGSGPG